MKFREVLHKLQIYIRALQVEGFGRDHEKLV